VRVNKLENGAGVTVNLELDECALFVKLAEDAEKANQDRPGVPGNLKETRLNYFSVSLSIGRQISALFARSPIP
jgi:hypothetical protein